MSQMRDLATYVDNELQASAVASCFTVFIKSDNPTGSLLAPEGEDTVDSNGNQLDHIEPGIVTRLAQNEDVSFANPGRPNSASEPWINLMLRGISAGTGTNYEAVAKDFSKTSYSSSRTSKLEDRPRIKRWQNHVVWHFCQPVWDEFMNAAARQGLNGFPSSTELLEDRRAVSPVEWQLPEQEWVDPAGEQSAAYDSISAYMSTYQDELGSRGRSWRATFYQAAKEKTLRERLGLLTDAEHTAAMMAKQTDSQSGNVGGANVASLALNGAQITSLVDVITQVGTGAIPNESAKAILLASFPSISAETIAAIVDPIQSGSISADGVPAAIPEAQAGQQATPGVYMGLSTQQWNRNTKAIGKTLAALADGSMSEVMAREFLKSTGMPTESIDVLITDALDGTVDADLPSEEVASA
jgi:hypothetical protein